MLSPIIIFGGYIICHGHLTPGGGFQGGVVIASAIALLIIAFEDKIIKNHLFSLIETIGLTFFISIAFVGIFKNTFFYNFLSNTNYILGKTIYFGANSGYLNSGGIIPLMNLAVGVEVASALSFIILSIKNK